MTDEVVLYDEKLLGTTNNADVEAAMKDGNWLDRGHLFEVEKDGQGDGALEGLEHTGGQVAATKMLGYGRCLWKGSCHAHRRRFCKV